MPDASFDGFFRRDFARLVAFLRKAGFGPEAAEDAAAEAMAQAYRCWSSLISPSAWVRKAAFRLASNQAERHRTGPTRAMAGGWLVHSCDDGEQQAEIEEQPGVLELLAQLPPRQRQVMAWRLEGFGIAEIAELMTMSEATVRSHLRHARDALRPTFDASRLRAKRLVPNGATVEEVPHHGTAG